MGASGGIFGLAGGLITSFGFKGLGLSKRARWKLVLLIFWTAWNLYPDAASPEIDNAAHAGGLITGLIAGALVASRFGAAHKQRRWVFAGFGAVLVLFAVSIHYYYDGYVVPVGNAIRAFDSERKGEALREVRVALQKKPDSRFANILAGRLYLEMGDYASTEDAARRALAADRDDDQATYLLGSAQLHTGRCAEAQALAFDRLQKTGIINASKSHYETVGLLAGKCNNVAAGDRYLSENKVDKAIEAYKKAIKSDPGNSQAQLGLARAYQAKACRRKLMTRLPKQPKCGSNELRAMNRFCT
jgi:predicted negative regulator of RcsB-dependent stress response